MENAKMSLQGFIILAIGVFFVIVSLVLYALDIIKSNRWLIYEIASVLLVGLGVVYIVLSRRLLQVKSKKKTQLGQKTHLLS